MDSQELLKRYRAVLEQLKRATEETHRNPDSVRLIAVSKTKPFEMLETLYEEGHRDFGENYVQELVEKSERAHAKGMRDLRWHFLGHLQTNKVKLLLPHVFLIHSVDSTRLLQEIEKRSHQMTEVLIEVKLDPEESKTGIDPSEIGALLSATTALSRVKVKGLMGIPDPNRIGGAVDAFQRLARLAQVHHLTELSMGMTADYKEAIQSGSTFIRVGTAIFGERS